MKFLLIFFIIMVLVFRWRSSRTDSKLKAAVDPSRSPQPSGPQTMVACTQCGMHVVAEDAVQGSKGTYCSVAHRQLREP